MNIQRFSENICITAQMAPAELAEVAANGFRSVICNRPEGEDSAQPATAAMRAAAEAQGLAFLAIPVVLGQVSDTDVAAFRDALDELPGPTLAYCRTGTRAAMLWALGHAPELGAETVLKVADEAGYNIAMIRPRLAAI